MSIPVFFFEDDSQKQSVTNDPIDQIFSFILDPLLNEEKENSKEKDDNVSASSERFTIFDLYKRLEPGQIAVGAKTGIQVTIDEQRNLLNADHQTYLPMSVEVLEDTYSIIENEKEKRILVPSHIAMRAYSKEGFKIEVDFRDITYSFVPNASDNPLIPIEAFYEGKWYIIEP